MDIKSIRIAEWNANGLTNHKTELINFLHDQKIDVMLVSETHFTERTFFRIPHYSIYHTNHPDGTAHGGAAIIIRNSLPHYEQPQYRTNKIQATTIQINALPWSFDITAIYCPPRHRIEIIDYEMLFQHLGGKFLIGGDWNAKNTNWGSRLTTTKGRHLHQAIVNHNCSYLSTGQPTYWPTDPQKIPDLLDFFVLKNIATNYTTIEANWDLSSDHTPIIVTLSTHIISRSKPPKLSSPRTDWDSFRSFIEDHINLTIKLQEPDDIDTTVDYFTKVIQEAAWKSTPPEPSGVESSCNTPLFIRELVAEKRRARCRWQRSRNRIDKIEYNRLTRQLKSALQNIRNTEFEAYITNLSKEDHSIWKATKKFKRPITHIPPIRKEDDSWAKTDKEKASIFAKHLAEVFSTPTPQGNNNNDDTITRYLVSPCPMTLPINSYSPSEVKQEITRCSNYKAPGFDLITGRILKELPRKALVMLTTIYNSMLRLAYFPMTWKFAQIILIPKPGKPPNNVTSYRPISLLPIMSKIFERLLLKRLTKDVNLDEIIPSHQFGFREHHSTIQQSHRIVNTILTSLEEKKLCTAAFLDIQQAFDRVWHDGILYKLKHKLPTPYYILLKSYLSDRYFQTKYNLETSSYHPIKSGVPQGSVLGPLLYLIFTADIPITNNTTIATFADDTAIVAVDKDPQIATEKLQIHLNQFQDWIHTWRVQVNQAKSAQITFTYKTTDCPPVSINNTQLPVTNQVKYLGLTMDRRLTWKQHITAKKTQINLKLKQMQWLLGRKSKLATENKILLYKSILKPIWTYGVQLWGCAKPSNTKILQRVQSKVLRMIFDAPWYVSNKTLHDDSGIPLVQEEIRRLTTNYLDRLAGHPNEQVSQLRDPPEIRRRLKRRWPTDVN